jgi:RNA-directed DNA polymerase
MMALVDLVVELKRLLADHEANYDKLVDVLARHSKLAEFEVARFMVGQAFLVSTETRLKSADPDVRMPAVRSLGLVFARAQAARLLRRAVKDPDPSVAAAAIGVARDLRLSDVSPPDTRFKPRRRFFSKRGWNRGGWNPSGWLFGLRPDQRRPSRLPEGLPRLSSRDDLAKFLGIQAEQLSSFMRAGVEPGSGYVEFERPKRNGGTRRIAAPRAPLRRVQRQILDKILAPLDAHSSAHGFIKGRSILSNAGPHVGTQMVVKIDLENFFPTVHYRRVKGLFTRLGYVDSVAAALAGLTTYRPKLDDGRVAWPGVLPQGAPTSPAIANLICRRLDARLTALAKKYGATYSRYADDLCFSFQTAPDQPGRFLWWVNAVCQQEGFFENVPKRRLMRSGGRQRVTGLVVNQKVAIPRADRRRFKAILANCKKHGVESQARGRERFREWLSGYAAYVRMVHPVLGAKWQREIEALPK